MKHIIVTILAGTMLMACSQQPEQTLGQKLEGKTAEERQETLRLECLNSAERAANPPLKSHTGHRSHLHADSAETKRLKDICQEMNKLEENHVTH